MKVLEEKLDKSGKVCYSKNRICRCSSMVEYSPDKRKTLVQFQTSVLYKGGGIMICEYALQMTVLNAKDESNFKLGNRKTYRDKEGHLTFFKRIKATKYDKFKEEMNQKGKIKIT